MKYQILLAFLAGVDGGVMSGARASRSRSSIGGLKLTCTFEAGASCTSSPLEESAGKRQL